MVSPVVLMSVGKANSLDITVSIEIKEVNPNIHMESSDRKNEASV